MLVYGRSKGTFNIVVFCIKIADICIKKQWKWSCYLQSPPRPSQSTCTALRREWM